MSTKGLCKDKSPKHPTSLGASVDKNASEAWFANARATNLLSCAGMIAAYLRRLSSTRNEDSHFAALDAAGVDSTAFEEVIKSDAGMAYVAEVEQIADTLGVLIISAVIDIGTSSAAAAGPVPTSSQARVLWFKGKLPRQLDAPSYSKQWWPHGGYSRACSSF